MSVRSKTYTQSQYLNHLVDPSFQGVNGIFVLCFENENDRTSHSEYYLPVTSYKLQIRQVTNFRKAFDNNLSADIKLSKTQ